MSVTKFLLFLLLLPAMSFGLFDGIASLPWAIIIFPFLVKRNDLGRYLILFSFLLLLFIIQLMFLELKMFYFIKSIIALINSTILLPVFLSYNRQTISKVIDVFKIYLILSIIIGCLQMTVPHIREATAFMFGHASGFGLKGPPGLSYEPSRSALDMIYIFTTLMFVNKFTGKGISKWLIILVVAYLLLVNKSITAYLFLSVYFFFEFFLGAKFKYRLAAVVLAPLISFMFFQFVRVNDVHAINSLVNLWQSSNKDELVFSLAGHRLTGLLGSFGSISFFGEGFGNWVEVMEAYISQNSSLIQGISHYRTVGNKVYAPMTFIGRFMLEIGILGIVLYFSLLVKKIPLSRSFREIRYSAAFITIATSLVFLSYGSNPLPFICLGVLVNTSRTSMYDGSAEFSDKNELLNIYG